MLLAEMAEALPGSPVKSEKPQKAFSCLRCFERKVKCDKNHPCSNCVKANVQCHFRLPSAPKRKRKRATEDILLERLKRAEDLLKSKGIDTSAPETKSPSTTELGPLPQQAIFEGLSASNFIRNPAHDRADIFSRAPWTAGKLIQDEGRARFIDNNLWSSLSDEFVPKDAIGEYSSADDDDDDETLADEANGFVLGLTPSSTGVSQLHPSPGDLFKLWQLFLDNVNPMTKVIHYPSLQETLVKASRDLENIPRGLEALMFAIYHAAVCSLDDSECEQAFGESRRSLVSRYRHGTRRALARARFLGTADLVVLQAFFLYVLMIRPETDARTVWTLAGVANRIAQSMGVHRDGTALGVPPFETELKRRIWWQITILDFRSAELSGSGRFGDISLSDTEVPTNVNDSEIWPGMKDPPVASERGTEMMGCLLRCEFGKFWKEKFMEKTREGNNVSQATFTMAVPPSIEERDKNIDELEKRLEEKFLRYCEPSIPIHFLCSFIGRGAVNSMRMMAHHPRRYKDDSMIPESEKAILWKLSMKMLQSDNLANSTKLVKRFQWHTKVYFQWHAMIHILTQLKIETTGDKVDEAWTTIDEIYSNHSEFIIEWKKPLHAAVGGLCLKAWDARVKGRLDAQERGEFMAPISVPDYIQMLRQQRSMPRRRSTTRTPSTSALPSTTQLTPPTNLPTPLQSTSMHTQTPTPPLLPPDSTTTNPNSMAWEPQLDPSGSNNYNNAMAGSFNSFGNTPNAATQFYMDPSISYGFDPNIATMNWNQWDSLLQDFELGGTNPKFGSSGNRMFQ